jgi:OFA family oxalate/formate antiporter-like MFS transporter
MGFGLSAVVFAPLKKVMIIAWGVDGTLFVLGVFVCATAYVGAKLIRNPPPNWTPPQRTRSSIIPPRPTRAKTEDVTPKEFIRTPVFYGLWLALAAVIGGGLTAIGLLTAFGERKLGLLPTEAALAISFFSLVNGLGRPVAGWFADRIGTFRVMIIAYTIQAAVFLSMPWVATSRLLLLICSLFLGAGYAVTFALFPVVVAAGYGTKYLGVNYGLVFSAFGLGAVTGLVGSRLLDVTGSFTPAFLLAGIATVIGLSILILLRIKQRIS